MKQRTRQRFFRIGSLTTSVLCFAACSHSNSSSSAADAAGATPVSLATPRVEVLDAAAGGDPLFVRGDFGHLDAASMRTSPQATAQALQPLLEDVAQTFSLSATELRYQKSQGDALGYSHHRYQQTHGGLDVVGGDLVVHVNDQGVIYAVNSSTVSTPAALSAAQASVTQAAAEQVALKDVAAASHPAAAAQRLVYLVNDDRVLVLAWEVVASASRSAAGIPIRDLVYVDAKSGATAAIHPQIFTAKSRKVYDEKNGTNQPGTLVLSEGGATSKDTSVQAAYDNTGTTYDFYHTNLARDSWDNAGGVLISSVHYDSNYGNAYWDGSQMVYGDGDGVELGPLALALDVTAHELTHGVTQDTANLNYSGESGGLNEGFSDIMGESTEAWHNGGVNANTWLVGEDVWTPGTPGDALRYMNDPAKDGSSADYWTASVKNLDVHYSSGLANLAYYLTVQGGTHPRGKSSNVVAGIGIEKAYKIYYRALTTYMTSTTNFAGARVAVAQAATDLYDSATVASVNNAWAAVGVGSSVGSTGGSSSGSTGSSTGSTTGSTTGSSTGSSTGSTTGSSTGSTTGSTTGGSTGSIILQNGVPVTAVSGAKGSSTLYTLQVPAGATNLSFVTSGGTGDADLYVSLGTTPTTSTYDYRGYTNGNAESIAVTSISAGTYYVVVQGYAAYSGLQIVATFTAPTGGTTGGTSGGSNGSTTGGTSGGSTGSTTGGSSGGSTGGSDGVPVLTNGSAVSVSGAKSTNTYYKVAVPAGASTLRIAISGGTGDADMYASLGVKPTTTQYDYGQWLNGNNETITVAAPAAGTYYILVRGYKAYSGVTLSASY